MTVGGIPLREQDGLQPRHPARERRARSRSAPCARVPGPRDARRACAAGPRQPRDDLPPGHAGTTGRHADHDQPQAAGVLQPGGSARARRADVTLRVTPTGELDLDDMKIALPSVSIGVMEVSNSSSTSPARTATASGRGRPRSASWRPASTRPRRTAASSDPQRRVRARVRERPPRPGASRCTRTSTSPTSAPALELEPDGVLRQRRRDRDRALQDQRPGRDRVPQRRATRSG